MNRTCDGDVFKRWGETWARCFMDSTLFQITAPVDTCPNCGRPWNGAEGRTDWNPNTDPDVHRMDAERTVADLRAALAAAEAREKVATERLEEGIGALVELARRDHGSYIVYRGRGISDIAECNPSETKPCKCGADAHNAEVNAALAALDAKGTDR